jgi:hypothetical protein
MSEALNPFLAKALGLGPPGESTGRVRMKTFATKDTSDERR